MRILLDGDWLLYTAGFAAQKTRLLYERGGQYFEFENVTEAKAEMPDFDASRAWLRSETDPVEHTLHSVKIMIQKCSEAVESKFGSVTDLSVFIDGDGNFRNRIATIRPYKGNRASNARPLAYSDIRAYLLKTWDAHVVHYVETDDRIATEATRDLNNSIICGVDKDYLQVPCWHYNPSKGFKRQSQEAAGRFLWYQVLAGDSADNIGGCYKIGPKKAKALVSETEWPDLPEAVEVAYAQSIDKYGDVYNGLDEQDALRENLALLYLLRRDDEIEAAKVRDCV